MVPEALDAPVGVFNALDAKGLEFDHVVVVEPAALVSPDRSGLRLLYVTLTRATQTLAVVHHRSAPRGARGDGHRQLTGVGRLSGGAGDIFGWSSQPWKNPVRDRPDSASASATNSAVVAVA